MNSFYTKIGPQLAKKHKSAWQYYGETVEDEVHDIQTDVEEVISLCKDIITLKSSGIDDISSKLCKDAFLAIPHQITHMFNCSLTAGKFPKAWKMAKVVPIFKGGDREEVSNYRPISLLTLPGKILEKIVHKQISNFLEVNHFLTDNQGGFRKGFSTTSTIADLTDDLFSEVIEGRTTLAAFIDLQKAFDMVDYNILLNKLLESGIRGKTFRWCKSYLSNRTQRTIVNGLTSQCLPISCGVPQGSVLGPLFFLIYVNDLQEALQGYRFKLYADDTVIYCSGVNATEASQGLQEGLNAFCKWSTVNKLSINTKKTKLMVFGSRSKVKKANNLSVRLNGDKLKRGPTFKYLGLD